MLHTKFQVSEPSDSEEEDFRIFFIHVYGSIYDPVAGTILGPGPFV